MRGTRVTTNPDADDVAPDTGAAVPPFHVVGVGASAGGLEALTTLLSHAQLDELAMVVVQHQAAHQSALPEVLGRATAAKVVEARDGVKLEPRHVYVIPPQQD